MTERMPFEGVNRAPVEPQRVTLEELRSIARANFEAARLLARGILLGPKDFEKLKAWMLENGIHPITGEPYP